MFINCDIQFGDRLMPLAIFNYRHAFLPSSSPCAPGFSSGVMQHRLPMPDGGQEVVEVRFVHPLDALAEHRFKKIMLMPPQHYILTTLEDRTPAATPHFQLGVRIPICPLAFHNPFLILLSPWTPLAPQGM